MNDASYTCPMHPEVRQDGPGDCPKCGMALEPRRPEAAKAKVEWTCPMHPEVVRDEPGDCPKCGMALEPRTIGADEEENKDVAVAKEKGAQVIGATVNSTGSLIIRAEKIGADTVLSRIVRMVSEAQRSRAPVQKLVDRVAGYFVPAVIAIALLAFVIWSLIGPEPRMAYALIVGNALRLRKVDL